MNEVAATNTGVLQRHSVGCSGVWPLSRASGKCTSRVSMSSDYVSAVDQRKYQLVRFRSFYLLLSPQDVDFLVDGDLARGHL